MVVPEFSLHPAMSSRKLQALAFIKQYFLDWGVAPSQGEIGGALGVSRKRAHALVHALKRDGLIEHEPGTERGIALPGKTVSELDAVRALAAAGWRVNPRMMAAAAPVTDPGLPVAPVLDYLPESDDSGRECDDEAGGYGSDDG